MDNTLKEKIENVMHIAEKRADEYQKEDKVVSPLDLPFIRTDTEIALLKVLNSMEKDELIILEAIMLLGRGDFEKYEDSLSYTKDSLKHEPKEQIVGYVNGKIPLGDYLKRGFEKMKLV